MYPGVELRLYRYAVALAEELSFTHAALRLHVSQPTLSAQIRDLEQELGVKLFERSKGGQRVVLTAAGEAFAAEARLTLFHAERAVQGARAAKGLHRGLWSIGYSPLIDLRILSRIRTHLSTAFPVADVRLASAHTSEQADALLRGKLQAGILILPVHEHGITCEPLFKQALLLALPEQHPLAKKDAVEVSDLHQLPLVTIRGDIEPRFGQDLNRVFGVARIKPQFFQEATTQAEALELVSEGNVGALTMPSAQVQGRAKVVFRPFVDELLTAETGLAHLGENCSPILNSLKAFLLETFRPLDAEAPTNGRGARQMALF
jgi:DNA-binding transcriptional LysR family regulator